MTSETGNHQILSTNDRMLNALYQSTMIAVVDQGINPLNVLSRHEEIGSRTHGACETTCLDLRLVIDGGVTVTPTESTVTSTEPERSLVLGLV